MELFALNEMSLRGSRSPLSCYGAENEMANAPEGVAWTEAVLLFDRAPGIAAGRVNDYRIHDELDARGFRLELDIAAPARSTVKWSVRPGQLREQAYGLVHRPCLNEVGPAQASRENPAAARVESGLATPVHAHRHARLLIRAELRVPAGAAAAG